MFTNERDLFLVGTEQEMAELRMSRVEAAKALNAAAAELLDELDGRVSDALPHVTDPDTPTVFSAYGAEEASADPDTVGAPDPRLLTQLSAEQRKRLRRIQRQAIGLSSLPLNSTCAHRNSTSALTSSLVRPR